MEHHFPKKNSKIKFTKIDTAEFEKIIEYLDTNIGGDHYYFISKQEKIGDFQPIIIDVDASHYNDLLLIVLDKMNLPVSYLVLNKGVNEDTHAIFNLADSLYRTFHCGASLLQKNEIYWYRVNNYSIEFRMQSTPGAKAELMGGPRWPYDDSIKYLSVIQSNGNITTKLIDSVRWLRGAHYRRSN